MKNAANRMPLIDALKAVAAILIVMHHLAAYGPLAAAFEEFAPRLIDGLYDYGRIAVQVFLVIGGFLAARGLSPQGDALTASPLGLIWKRYVRLAIPYLAAIGLAIVCAAIADHWMDDESIPTRASFTQWLAHVFLLQGLLGFESLSAGVWYIAIDFQLFALMAGLLWLGRIRFLAPALVLLTGIASLFWFNRDTSLDNWAIYFFGSYALGAAAWWVSARQQKFFWMGVILTVAIAALVLDFRLRIAVALAVALLLAFSRRSGFLETWPNARPLASLGKISYSIFLVHFPVCLLINAFFAQLDQPSITMSILVALIALTASIAAGALFYRWIESPAASQRITGALSWTTNRVLGQLARLPLLSGLLQRAMSKN